MIRLQYSLRSLFIFMTLGTVLAYGSKLYFLKRSFSTKAADHALKARLSLWNSNIDVTGVHDIRDIDNFFIAYRNYHSRLFEKYQLAANQPWQIVDSDPQEPQPNDFVSTLLRPHLR